FTIVGPFIVKLAIDGLTADLTVERIVQYALLLVGAALVAGAARYGMREFLNGISRRIETDLRNDLFSHLLRLPPQFYDRWRTGDLMSRATNDVQAVRQVAGPSIMYLVNTVTIGALALGFMIWISPRLTAIAMIPMVMMPPLVIWIGKKINVRFERIQEQFSEISNFAQENLAGIRIVKAYGREADRSEAFAGLNAEYRRRNMDLARIWGAFFPILTFMGGLGSVLVLLVGGQEVIKGAITVGDYVAFGFYLVLLMWPMIAVGWVTNQIQRGAASMGRINTLLAEPHVVENPDDPISPAAMRGAIEFRDVSFRYPGTERWVLKNVSFRIEPGQTVAVVGGTASGKSTLVRLIPRLYDVGAGGVEVDGVDVRQMRLEELRDSVGMVPQEPFLFSMSLRRNLTMGDPDVVESDQLDRALDIAQLRSTLGVLPDGLDTALGERGINLSGGQKQRATIARALYRDTPILVLDDSLSAVDTVTEEAILGGLREFMADRTAIVVSHRVTAVARADMILVLEEGELVETGTHDELLARGGVYTRLLERQLLEDEIEREEAV
ncbi:MAG: ABC transporter ATP-binding protein, partial [Gemmatimonadetes bacterium]|nr:ABC transporter ATP-binding protein [Gemmatimonadota bacterium]